MATVTVDRAALQEILGHVRDADASLLGKPGVSEAMVSLRRAALVLQGQLGKASTGEASR